MASLYHIVILVLLFIISHSSAYDAQGHYCNSDSTISSSSKVSSNIRHLLADIISRFEAGSTLIEASNGEGKDQVNSIAQCVGQVDSKTCLGCIHDAAQEIRTLCPNDAEAWIWYDYCFLRYSQQDFYGKLDTSNGMLLGNTANVTNPSGFAKELDTLFARITSNAAKPPSGGFGKGEKDLSKFDTLYGLVQCTGDLSSGACSKCLSTGVQNFKGFCSGRKGCRVMYSGCYLRYELYPFYSPFGFKGIKSEKLEKMIIHN